MLIEFKQLTQVSCKEIITLNTHPSVLKHMPLGDNIQFDEAFCRSWVAGKEQHWDEHGYGVWAFMVDSQFAGWGGFQDESGDADLALVLHPNYWGIGKQLIEKMVERAFLDFGFSSITIHLPLTREKLAAVFHYGFVDDGEADFDGVRFKRYRLSSKSIDNLTNKKPCLKSRA